jgi:hypothetical protein
VDQTTALDWITAIGTLGAVVVAVWATIGSQRAIHRELEVGALVTRRREAMELLQAFEAIQTFRRQNEGGIRQRVAAVREAPAAAGPAQEELLGAQASFGALLRVSEEDLPIARGMTFRRIPFGSTDHAEKAHLDQAPQLGDPEAETSNVMTVRAEIVAAIEALNDRIKQTARRRRARDRVARADGST